ncbi:MAG TPA: hypothetical protein VFV66_24970 [Nonomuraea sp.]|nr:hypothetical protein [Nonomuraea sp.]
MGIEGPFWRAIAVYRAAPGKLQLDNRVELVRYAIERGLDAD